MCYPALTHYLVGFCSMFAVAPFITQRGYHDSTQICDENFYGMDSYLAFVGTGLFYLSIFPIIHTVINGLVPGVPDRHHTASSSLAARNRALHKLKLQTQELKGWCSLPRKCSNMLSITASHGVNLLFGFSGREGIDDMRGRRGRGAQGVYGDEYEGDMCVVQQRIRCRPMGRMCWNYPEDSDEEDSPEKQRERRRREQEARENTLSCTLTLQIDRLARLTVLFAGLGVMIGYLLSVILTRRAVLTGQSAQTACVKNGQTFEHCHAIMLASVARAQAMYSLWNMAYYSAVLALPAAVIWTAIRAVYNWHVVECYEGVEFGNLQQVSHKLISYYQPASLQQHEPHCAAK